MNNLNNNLHLFSKEPIISDKYMSEADAVFLLGDSAKTLKKIPDNSIKLIITSPPYNLNKVYEDTKSLDEYFKQIEPVIKQLIRVLSPDGSLCWEVGNYIENGEVFPLDMYYYPYFKEHGLKLRNRIIWHFDHGLHASKRLSGRYETILWFTKGDSYTFNLDPIRVPSKYPGKRNYKPGPNYGKPSGNPLGKNPSDIWKIIEQDWEHLLWDIPNVKANHPEKTTHPCQFPIELVERCVLALTNTGDWVLDPFSGVGSTVLAALKLERKVIGCEKEADYITIAQKRVQQLVSGKLPYRPLGKPVYKPTGKEKVAQRPEEWNDSNT